MDWKPSFDMENLFIFVLLVFGGLSTNLILPSVARERWERHKNHEEEERPLNAPIGRCTTSRVNTAPHPRRFEYQAQYGQNTRRIGTEGGWMGNFSPAPAQGPIPERTSQIERHPAVSCAHGLPGLGSIAVHRVADRPDWFEPRRVKRRPKRYARLMKSRQETKRDILNGISEN
jgi:hypothetical protein